MRYLARTTVLTGLTVVVGLAIPVPAAAYVGPGAGLAVIGAAIAVVGAVFAAVGGFVWYPVKRLWKAVSRSKSDARHDP